MTTLANIIVSLGSTYYTLIMIATIVVHIITLTMFATIVVPLGSTYPSTVMSVSEEYWFQAS